MALSAIIPAVRENELARMRVEATTVIRATPEQVFRFISTPENGPRWQEAAVWTRVTTPGPVALGSTMEHLGTWLWMRIRSSAVVTVYEPPRRYGYDIITTMTPQPSLMRYALDATQEGTRLSLSNEASMQGWMKRLEPLLRRNVQGMFDRDVARLRAVIEAEVAT